MRWHEACIFFSMLDLKILSREVSLTLRGKTDKPGRVKRQAIRKLWNAVKALGQTATLAQALPLALAIKVYRIS